MAGRQGGADTDEQPRRRKRNMLRLFYGADTNQQQDTGDPLDIDCSGFNSDVYLKQMYGQMALPQLVAKERSLSQQVKTLDSDMQTLVYENYNKFISATDTIRQMKSKVDDMEEEMGKLSEHMEEIGKLSDGITSTLSVKRTRIKKLTESHLLLKKLQFLFELPSRLKKCLERKAFAEAVKYYDRAAMVLEQYKTLDSFKGIYDECQSIMAEVVASIDGLINEKGASMDQIMENLELLLLLKHDASDLCQRAVVFMKSTFEEDCVAQKAAYKTATARYDPEAIAAEEEDRIAAAAAAAEAAAAAAAQAATKADDGADGGGEAVHDDEDGTAREDVDRRALFDEDEVITSPVSPNTDGGVSAKGQPIDVPDSAAERYPAVIAKHPVMVFALHGSTTCLPQLTEWIYCYLAVFVAPGEEIVRSPQPHDAPVTPRVARNKEIATTATDALQMFVDEVVGDGYIGDCTKVLFDEMASGVDTETVIAAITTLSEGALALHDTVPGAALVGKDEEMAVMTVRKLCRIRGDALQADFARRVSESTAGLVGADPAQLPTALGALCRWVYSQCCDTLRTLEPLVAEDFACRSRFFERELQERSIRRGVVQGFVGSILSHCRQVLDSVQGSDTDAATFPTVILFLSALCIRLESGLIEKLVVFSVKLFPTQASSASPSRRPALDDASEMQVAQRAHEARTTAMALLDRYVREVGTAIALRVRAGLGATAWAAHDLPEPTTVSPHVLEIADALVVVQSTVNELFGDEDGTKRNQPRTYEDYVLQRKSVDTNMAKLFSDRIEIFGEVEFETGQVVFATVKVVLKATSECIRMLTLSTHGLQQFEVDVHLLGIKLWPLLESEDCEQTAGTMLAQLIGSASTRCTEPSPLSESIIRMICSKVLSSA